jgi:hypothetical protein
MGRGLCSAPIFGHIKPSAMKANINKLNTVHPALRNALSDALNTLERKHIDVVYTTPASATDKAPSDAVTLKLVRAMTYVKDPLNEVAETLKTSADYFSRVGKVKLEASHLTLSVAKEHAAKEEAPVKTSKKSNSEK